MQGRLPFAVRADRRIRSFKRWILAITAIALAGIVALTPTGRYAASVLVIEARGLLNRLIGLPPDRSLKEERVHVERLRNMASARQALSEAAEPGSALDLFLQLTRMDAASAVIRWGNVDRMIVLSSAVFEPDDERSYRLRPGVRSIWIIGLALRKSLGIFLIPDTAEARAAAKRKGDRSCRTRCRIPTPGDAAAPSPTRPHRCEFWCSATR